MSDPRRRFPDEGFVPINKGTTGAAPIPQTVIYETSSHHYDPMYPPVDKKYGGSVPLATDTPGYKLDSGKLRYDLLPPDIVEALTYILTWACTRESPPPYPERNWEKGMSWLKVFAALMRHLWAWRRGDNADPESGKSHLWHAAACIAFLVTYERTHPELDDRNPHAVYKESFPQPDGYAYRGVSEAGSDPRRP
jgi:hypothetical protein